MRNNSTNHSRGIIDSTWGWVPGLYAHSEVEAILEQRLLFVSLCEARIAFTRLWGIIEQSLLKYGLRSRVSVQARHSSSGAVNDASGMIRTIIPHSLVKAILASHNETKSNRCSSMASASEWACKPGTRPQVLSMMPLEWFVLLFLIVLWRPSLPHTMKQRAIVAQVWPPLPSEHAKDECLACMLTRKRRPYLSNDCSLFHCVRQGWPSQDYEE